MNTVCGAKKRQGEGICRRPAGAGTSHPGVGRCKLHGGSTPNHDVAAAKATLAQIAERVDLPDPMPHDALLFCVRCAAAQVVYATEKVNALRHAFSTETGRLDPWIVVRQQALDLLARVSRMAIDAKADERRDQHVAAHGDRIAVALEAGLQAAGVSREKRSAAVAVVEAHLLQMESTVS